MIARGAAIVPSTVRSSQVRETPPVKHMHDVRSLRVYEGLVGRHQRLVVIYSIAAYCASPLIYMLLFCVISCSTHSRNVRCVWAFNYVVHLIQTPEICDLLVNPFIRRLHSVKTLWSIIRNLRDHGARCMLRSPQHVQSDYVRAVADQGADAANLSVLYHVEHLQLTPRHMRPGCLGQVHLLGCVVQRHEQPVHNFAQVRHQSVPRRG